MRHDECSLAQDVLSGRMSRRQLIRRLMAAGLSLSATTGLLRAAGMGGEEVTPSPVGAASLRPWRGGTIRVAALDPGPAGVDPVTLVSEGATFTAQMAGEYLCSPRPDYTLAPRLATSWHATKADAWTFNIRRGVKWHDGSPFTADDVVATFDRLTDPSVGSAALELFRAVLSRGHTRRVDSHTVVFHLDRPFADFPYLVSAFNYTTIILPKNYATGSFTRGGIGTGPYVLRSYRSGRGATFVRNPRYWAHGLPYLDGLEVIYYPEYSAIVLAMEAGAVDVHPRVPYLGSQALFANPDIRILTNPSSEYRELHMRVDKHPFTDRRVRQAVALSLDRPALVRGLLHGLGQAGNDHPFAPVFPVSRAATAEIPLRQQDYTAARALLAQAGYLRGITVTLTTESYLEIPQYAALVKAQLKPAGINVRTNVESQPTYYGSGAKQPWLTVPMGIVDWAPRGIPSQLIDPAYLTSSIPPPFNLSIWNSAHWSNRTFDHLIAAYERELDQARRQQFAVQAARLFHREVPAVIAYWLKDLRAVRSNVRGLASGPGVSIDPSTMWRSS
jgi:peptide/nickel transport system substrate-binding protein